MSHKEQQDALLGTEIDLHDDLDQQQTFYTPPRRRLGVCRCIGWIIALILVILLSGLVGAWLSLHYFNIDQNCASHTTHWSPLLDEVSIKYEPKTFDGNFMKENVYRKQGSPEVDEAWEALGVDYRAGVISHEDGLASGLDDSFVQRSDKHGGGFLVNVEGMHHLHCLNLVRKSLYFNYDYYKELGGHAFKNDGEVFRLHVTHCLDTIRQVLMCNVDTAVLGQVWVEKEKPIAFPDFNTKHVCKNYDAVRKWAKKIQAPPHDKLPKGYLKLPNKKDVYEKTP